MGTNLVEVVGGEVAFHPEQIAGVLLVVMATAVGASCVAFIIYKGLGWALKAWAIRKIG